MLGHDLVGALGQILDAVVPVERRHGDRALAGAVRPGARGRRGSTARAPCPTTTPPSSAGCPGPPGRSLRPSSCRSRSPSATGRSGCSSCSACRHTRCRRSSPCCGAAATTPARPPWPGPGSGARSRDARDTAVSGGARADGAARRWPGRARPRSSGIARSPTSVFGLELAPLHVRVEVGPPGHQHGLRPRVGEEPHGLADRARRQIRERGQAQHCSGAASPA